MFFNVSLIAHKGINIFFDLQILVRIFLFNLSFAQPSLNLRSTFAQPSLILRSRFAQGSVELVD